MTSANKALIGGGDVDGVIRDVEGPGLLDEYQKLNGCETGKCKLTLGYKLPTKYVFHTVRPRYKKDYNVNGCYKSCLQKVLASNVNKVCWICCGVTGITGFGPRKAAKMALATVRLWLESNHFSIDHVIFCTYENVDYKYI